MSALISALSEGVCIKVLNSITLDNCDQTANNTQRNGNATFLDTIMIYQSMSGDIDSGTSTFTKNGGTNNLTLVADDQTLTGTIKVGNDSTFALKQINGSTFKGAIDGNITNTAGDTVSTKVGTVSVTLDSTSTWTLTADTYVTSFDGNAANIIANGYTLYVNGVALTGTK